MHPRLKITLPTRTFTTNLCTNGQQRKNNPIHLYQATSPSVFSRMAHYRTFFSNHKTILTQRSILFDQIRHHSKTPDDPNTPKVTVKFIHKDGQVKVVSGPVGMSVLDLAHANEIDLEGACEGALACSTCHVVVKDPELYKKLGEPTDEENDMLDLAFGLTETSRLGCQIKLAPELEGMELILPAATRNMAVDGYKPKPH